MKVAVKFAVTKRVGWAVAWNFFQEESPGSQGTVPGNTWAARADGKCNRKYTACAWVQFIGNMPG